MSRLTDLPGEVTSLVAAIVEALDLPLPSIEDGDERKHYRVQEKRVQDVTIGLSMLLRYANEMPIAEAADYVRDWTKRHPATYTPFDITQAEGKR
ncbi:hypothetical protein PV371_02365 [Streptomyces sp. TX20-6-3]|uniref:hypothetical protein n=1 Tax=Streptomyces sp. TX20-6-3 TaxID=3028705 RepID=UPI0029A38264|nr:hypothetical protein [Streptomyces sp. TX20-6-3]MDX2558498.1 hypothetical protein [Streptomyces sp. TX20-6-3]